MTVFIKRSTSAPTKTKTKARAVDLIPIDRIPYDADIDIKSVN